MDKEEGGQALVMVAIMFMALLFFVGLAVDAGQLFTAKRTQQEAADSAAFAGAIVFYQAGPGTPTATTVNAAINAAVTEATRNGYTNGVANTVVTVNSPPLAGPYAANVTHIEVSITRQVRTTLVPAESILNPVRARGVAGAEPLNNGYAVMSLDRGNTPSAFYADNQADIHLVGGGILVNSTSSTAAVNQQTSCSRFTVSSGSVDIDGNSASTWPTGCTPAFPGVNTAQPQKPDPFAGFPPPPTTGMTSYASLPGGSPVVLDPGIYETQIGGAGSTVFQLNTGVYITKYGINLAGNADIQSGAGGVFIFNTHTNYPGAFRPGIDTCGDLNLTGNASSTLAAMTTGPYANFVVYQDAACTNQMYIAGNGTWVGSGTFYLPSATFTFDGQNATLTGSQLVAKKVNIQGGNLTIDFAAGATAQPILPRLAE